LFKLNSYEKHIISNYLNANLRYGKKDASPTKSKKTNRKLLKYQVQTAHKYKSKTTRREKKGTIEQADLDTLSAYQSIEQPNKKEYSLKEEPMKHYVQEKIERKKR
jgi:hypothetical protein